MPHWMTRRWRLAAAAGSAALLVAACNVRPLEVPKPRGVAQTPGYFPQTIEKDVDLLFVIDNSGSMGDEQTNLSKNFPKLIDALRSPKLDNKIPNIHIGVISTDLGAGNYSVPTCEVVGGDGGKLQNKPQRAGCTPPKDRYISYIEGKTNIPGASGDAIQQVKDAFLCIGELGTEGCGFEQQLESARRALEFDRSGRAKVRENQGFLRKDALLAIVFITDEDDCSARNPQLFDPSQTGLNDPLGPLTSFRCFEKGIQCDINDRHKVGVRKNCVPAYDWLFKIDDYYNFFTRLKKRPDRVLMVAIAGPTNRVEVGKEGPNPVVKPSCKSSLGEASPAIRIKALVDKFEKKGNGKFFSICEGDFGPALKFLGEKIVASLTGQCIRAPLVTRSGAIICEKGDVFGPPGNKKGICKATCLDKADCTVVEIQNQGDKRNEVRKSIPKCPRNIFLNAKLDAKSFCKGKGRGICPCWRILKKPAPDDCKPSRDGSPYGLEIMRAADPQKGTVAEVACLTHALPWGSAKLADLEQCQE